MKRCPLCGADISDSYQEDDWDVGIIGGYYCETCDKGFLPDDDNGPEDYEL